MLSRVRGDDISTTMDCAATVREDMIFPDSSWTCAVKIGVTRASFLFARSLGQQATALWRLGDNKLTTMELDISSATTGKITTR